MKPGIVLVAAMFTVSGALVQAQGGGAAANPLTASQKAIYGIVKSYIARAAEKMPEEHYAFKPTPEVRSFGQLLGHVADAQLMICSAVLGEKAPMGGIEKSMTSKADLIKALGESSAYCDNAYGISDAAAAQPMKFMIGEHPKLSILSFNTGHDFEHYGNIVTYMRLKGLVPPSSEPQQQPRPPMP